MPRLDFAFLADAAEAQPGRKFYVLGGGIDSIGAPRFPVVHPHMSLVMRIVVDTLEADADHGLEIRLIDADGNDVTRATGTFSARGRAEPGREMALPLVMNLVNTRFERAGDYSMEISVNDQHAKSLPLRLQQVQQQQPGG